MNLDKLKESARKYEQTSQWRQAIDVYKKALREFEESGEGVPDPSLYNRIGDLEIKDGDSSAAIRAYEQAADLYTEQGFFNNAIALCSKILRLNPARSPTYLRLAQLNARKNFVGEAKKNLVEYIERMDALSHREEAFVAVSMFADQFSGNPDIRLMLVELLRASSRTEEARVQLEKLASELEQSGDATAARYTRERLATIGDDVVAPPLIRPKADPMSGLVFIDVGHPEGDADMGTPSVDGLEILRDDPAMTEAWRRDTADIDVLDLATTADSDLDAPDAVPELTTDRPFGDLADDEPRLVAEAEPLDIDAYPSVEAAGRVPASANPVTPTADDLVFLPLDGAEGAAAADADIDDVAAYSRDRSRLLFEIGDRAGGIGALEEAVRQYEATNRFEEAVQTVDDLIRIEPDAIFRYQKRVELAYRLGDRSAMLQSYLGLADALLRSGGLEHAVTVYRRVLEHDPTNAQARSALAMLVPAPPPPPPPPPPRPRRRPATSSTSAV